MGETLLKRRGGAVEGQNATGKRKKSGGKGDLRRPLALARGRSSSELAELMLVEFGGRRARCNRPLNRDYEVRD